MQTAYINCTILDGSEHMEPIPQMTVIVEDGKIISIEKSGLTPTDCQVINLKERYLMPGLINLHIHLPSSGKPAKKQTDATKLAKLITSTIAYTSNRSS